MKEFKNLDEQITILEYKGMTVEDKEYAKEVLLRENYFFLSGYRLLFMQYLDQSSDISEGNVVSFRKEA